eukprot:278741_1
MGIDEYLLQGSVLGKEEIVFGNEIVAEGDGKSVAGSGEKKAVFEEEVIAKLLGGQKQEEASRQFTAEECIDNGLTTGGDEFREAVFKEDKQIYVLITERLGDNKIYIDDIVYDNRMLKYLIGKLIGRDEDKYGEGSRELYYMEIILLHMYGTNNEMEIHISTGQEELIDVLVVILWKFISFLIDICCVIISIDNLVRPGVSKTLDKEERYREGSKELFSLGYGIFWNISLVILTHDFCTIDKLERADFLFGDEQEDRYKKRECGRKLFIVLWCTWVLVTNKWMKLLVILGYKYGNFMLPICVLIMIILGSGGRVIKFDILGITSSSSCTARLLFANGMDFNERSILKGNLPYGTIISGESRDNDEKDRKDNIVKFMRNLCMSLAYEVFRYLYFL